MTVEKVNGEKAVVEAEVLEDGCMSTSDFSEISNALATFGPGRIRVVILREKICKCGDHFYGPGDLCWICSSLEEDS